MARDNRVKVYIDGDAKGLEKATKQAQSTVRKFGDEVARGFGLDRLGIGPAEVAAGAVVALGAALADCTREAIDAQRVQDELAARLKSTGGAAGVTMQSANELAGSLSMMAAVDDELIVSAESVMLTFTKVGSEVFPEAMTAALDMSRAFGQDLQSSVIQVGKALQDPIQGVSALRRVGVQLSASQEAMIQQFVRSGDTLGAQKVILGELQTQVGGTAAAYGESLAGKMDRFNIGIGNLKQAVGELTIGPLTDIVEWAQKGVDGWNLFFEKYKEFQDYNDKKEKTQSGRFVMTQLRDADAEVSAVLKARDERAEMLEDSGISKDEYWMLGVGAADAFIQGWNGQMQMPLNDTGVQAYEAVVQGIRFAAEADPVDWVQTLGLPPIFGPGGVGILGLKGTLPEDFRGPHIAEPRATKPAPLGTWESPVGDDIIIVADQMEPVVEIIGDLGEEALRSVPKIENMIGDFDTMGRAASGAGGSAQTASPAMGSLAASIAEAGAAAAASSRLLGDTAMAMREMENSTAIMDAIAAWQIEMNYKTKIAQAEAEIAKAKLHADANQIRANKDAADDFVAKYKSANKYAADDWKGQFGPSGHEKDMQRIKLAGTSLDPGPAVDEPLRQMEAAIRDGPMSQWAQASIELAKVPEDVLAKGDWDHVAAALQQFMDEAYAHPGLHPEAFNLDVAAANIQREQEAADADQAFYSQFGQQYFPGGGPGMIDRNLPEEGRFIPEGGGPAGAAGPMDFNAQAAGVNAFAQALQTALPPAVAIGDAALIPLKTDMAAVDLSVTNLNSGLPTLGDYIQGDFTASAAAGTKVVKNMQTGLAGAAVAAGDLAGALADVVAQLNLLPDSLPYYLQIHSPSPMEQAFRGIGEALREMPAMPAMRFPAGMFRSGGSGGGGDTVHLHLDGGAVFLGSEADADRLASRIGPALRRWERHA